MGISVIEGREGSIYNDTPTFAFLYCNTRGVPFGPRFWDAEEALAVVEYITTVQGRDPRQMTPNDIWCVAENLRQLLGADWYDDFDVTDGLLVFEATT